MSSLDAEKDAMSSFRCPIDVSMMVTIDHNLFFGTLVTCDIVKRNYDILMTKTVLTTKTWSYHGNTVAFCSF